MTIATVSESAPEPLEASRHDVAARRKRVRRRLIAGNLLALLLMALLVAMELSASRQAYLQRAEDATDAIARSLAEAIDAEVSRVDMALRLVVRADTGDERRFAPDGDLARMLEDVRVQLPSIDGVWVVDDAGEPRLPAAPAGVAAVQAAAQSLLDGLRTEPGAGLKQSEPIDAGEHWALLFARPLGLSGGVEGAALALMSVRRLSNLLSGLELGGTGAISLRSPSMTLIARWTPQGLSPDVGSRRVSEQLAHLMATQPQAGRYRAVTVLDGIERANAYRRTRATGITVIVGLGTAEFLAPWRRHAAQTAGLAVLTLLVLTGSSAFGYRALTRETEAQLDMHREAHRSRALLMTASDGIHVLDRAGRLVDFSDAFAAMLGRDRASLRDAHMTSWDARHEAATLNRWAEQYPIGQRRRFSTLHRRADGSVIDVEIASMCARIDGQELIFCSARDVTDRQRLQRVEAESKARTEASERFLQALTDNVPVRIAYLDESLRYRFVNQLHVEHFDLAREQIIGRRWSELAGPGLDDAARAQIDALPSAARTLRIEHRETTARGERVIDTQLVPDTADDGRLRGVYVASADVTERHEQQRRIETALAEREALLREVYHRVKNNLQVVTSLLGLQRRALPEGPAKQALDDSVQRVRAMALVHEKLYQHGQLSAIALAEYAHDLVRQLGEASAAGPRGIELRAEVPPMDVPIDVAIPFGLLVTELVGNGLKHGFPAGRGGRVTVRLLPDGRAMRLEVEDNGAGLPRDFDLHRSSSMGLQLSAGLAAQLGGALEAHGPPGARFAARLSRLGPGALDAPDLDDAGLDGDGGA